MSKYKNARAWVSIRLHAVLLAAVSILAACGEEPVSWEERNGSLDDGGFSGRITTTMVGGFIDGYWATADNLVTENREQAVNPAILSQDMRIASDGRSGAVFLSWRTGTDAGEEQRIMQRSWNAAAGAYVWNDPADPNYSAVGLGAGAADTRFAVNRANGDAYALWNDGSNIRISEFMGSMGHFMGSPATLADSHDARFVIDDSGKAWLLTQSHMMGGYALNVFSRSGFSSWSAAAELHRMDMVNAMSAPHGIIATVVDGQGGIRVVWLEQQGTSSRLMTAVYFTGTSAWGTPTVILDSSGDTGVLDLAAIQSLSLSAEHGNSRLHLVIAQGGGSLGAVITMDYDGSSWSQPQRRDNDMGGMAGVSGDVQYAVYHNAHLVAWIEDHMGDKALRAMRFDPATGWGAVQEVALPEAAATPGQLDVAINHDGHAVALWVETTSGAVTVANSVQMPGMAWADKEMIAGYAAGTVLHHPVTAIQENGIPWSAWIVAQADGPTVSFRAYSSQRVIGVTTSGSNPGDGSGDGHDHDHGDGGSGGGDTGGGSGGGDTGSGIVIDGTAGHVSGYWGSAEQLLMDHPDAASAPGIAWQKLQLVDIDTVFLSWAKTSTSGEELKLMRGSNDGTGAYTWTDPNDAMLVPAGISANATMTQFVARTGQEGYALWDDTGTLKLSEFMEMSGVPHFMGTASLGEGHVPNILSSATDVYVVAQSHMMNGFGLDVYRRTAMNTWSAPVQLHRMGMDAANAIGMPHDSLRTTLDGNGNIRALWLETQAGDTRLMSALYSTGTGTWGSVSTLLDSAGDTHGVDVGAIGALAMSAEHGNANFHIALFTDSATDQAIYTIDVTGTIVGHPMRRDGDSTGMISINGDVSYGVLHDALTAVWVESHMGESHIMALRYTPASGWSAAEPLAPLAAGVSIAELGVTLNHGGDVMAFWLESDTDGVRVVNAIRANGGAWAMKELVASYAAGSELMNLAGLVHDNAVPWLTWNEKGSMGGMPMFTSMLSKRVSAADVSTPAGSTGGDVGSGGGGTGTGSGGGDTGSGGGDTGSGGGDTGSSGGDTGSGGGSTDAGITVGLWGNAVMVSSHDLVSNDHGSLTSLQLQKADNGHVYASWLLQSKPDPVTSAYTVTAPGIMRGVPLSGNYTWSDPANAMFKPVGFNAAATDNRFVVNPVTADAIAAWNANGFTWTSEFMSGMGHFMSNTSLDEGHAVKLLADSTGRTWLLAQTHMSGGFGLSIYERQSRDVWSDTPYQLHRMNMSLPYSMVGHFMIAAVDGMNNVRVIWLEEQGGTVSLQTATWDSISGNWGAVTTIPAGGMSLNRLAGGLIAGKPGSDELQVVLHQQDGMSRALFALGYTADDDWSQPLRLDDNTDTAMMAMAPVLTRNDQGQLLATWLETEASAAAVNVSGNLNVIKAKHYMPMMGWHATENVAQAALAADVTAVDAALDVSGDASVAWVESGSDGSRIIGSHRLSGNSDWSRKEQLGFVASVDGSVQDLALIVDATQLPLALWATRGTDGVNDTLRIWRNLRLTDMTDAIIDTGTGGGDTGGGSGGGDTGGGTGSGGGNDIPPTVNWSTPEMVSAMMHSTSIFRVLGPQLVLDDLGGASIRMAMINIGDGDGNSLMTVGNHVMRNADGSLWQNILMGSNLLDDLSNLAMIENISAVPTSGSLYGLIRDGEKLYLARYLPDAGWGKLEIPDVSARISRDNLQFTTNETGMVTLSWHESTPVCCDVNIHAKHYMVTSGWQETETLTVPAEAVLKSHMASDGSVYASWLEANPDLNVGGFNMKMAIYAPMLGWSAAINGPVGMRSAVARSMSSGEHKVVVVTDLASSVMDAYVVNNGGDWVHYPNINAKLNDDGVQIASHMDIRIVAGGPDHFMVAWREYLAGSGGQFQARYRTANIHYMSSGSGGMWHVQSPVEVGGVNTGLESDLRFVLDGSGNAWAAWTSVDLADNTDKVWVNSAPMGGAWGDTPELLAAYDMNAGNYAGHVSIAINALGKVGIAWDQHMNSGSLAMHHIWYVQNQ